MTNPEVKINQPKTKNISLFLGHRPEKSWIIIDLKNLVLGRVASFISHRIMGKHKATYTPHIDCGDNVILINANKIHLTGTKETDKKYHRHTGFVGGIKTTTPKELRQKNAAEIVKKAVERMLKSGPLANKQIKNLHIYNNEIHPHEAQQPTKINFEILNKKNSKN